MIGINGDRKDTGLWADLEKEIWKYLEKNLVNLGDTVLTRLFEVLAKMRTKILFVFFFVWMDWIIDSIHCKCV